MKCSLLTLSTFIDEELPSDRRAEVDAHLVGCPRCGAGVTTLREEKLRVSRLARVRVPPPSATALLESVGVSGAQLANRGPRAVAAGGHASPNRPWLEGRSSAALPWTPLRPVSPPTASEETAVPRVPDDAQPDLPFDRVGLAEERATPVMPAGAASVEWEDDTAPAPHDDVADRLPVAEDWELRVPGYAGPVPATRAIPPDPAPAAQAAPRDAPPHPAPAGGAAVDPQVGGRTPWDRPAETARVSQPEPVLEAAPLGPDAGLPRRAETVGGARGVWNRVRDVVGVRLALAGGGPAGDESMEIVTGPVPPRRALPPPIAGFESPTPRAATVARPIAGAAAAPALPGRAAGAVAWHPAAGPEAPAAPPPAPAPDREWNAFGASAYRESVPAEGHASAPPARQRVPIGRHARALRRETGGATVRLREGAAGVAAVLRRRGAALGTHAGQARGSLPNVPPRRLAMLAAGLVALVVVVAVLLSRSASPARPTTATVTPATAAPHASTAPITSAAPATSAPASTAPTTAPTQAPPAATTLRLGSGGTGFEVSRVRYGLVNGAQRIVFDLGAATSGATGSPSVVVSPSNPTVMLVTFTGVVPAGAISPPPGGGLVQSLALTSTDAGRTVFKLTLSRAAAASAFYLNSPLRLVLDVR